jgi:hypothetical protein
MTHKKKIDVTVPGSVRKEKGFAAIFERFMG